MSLMVAATRLRADCIAVGAHSRTLDDGAKLGVVASALVRAGMKSLLVVPSVRRGAAPASTGRGS
jgi:hypothetical protein